MSYAARASRVIIGVGTPMRHDDGVGPAVVEHLGSRHEPPRNVDLVILDGEPTRLIDEWEQRQLVVVIDAVFAGSRPGTVHRIEFGVDPVPPHDAAPSSHATGLAEAIALARALDRLPLGLVLLGVEPRDVSLGVGLSPEVEAAVAGVANRALVEVGRPDDQQASTRS